MDYLIDMGMKTCRVCKLILDYSMFHRDKTRCDGFGYVCKVCKKSSSNKQKPPSKEKKAEYTRRYYQTANGRDVTLRQSKKWQKTEKGQHHIKVRLKKERDSLGDHYIKQLLAKGRFSMKFIPKEMVELKRLHLLIKRLMKEES